jgi:RNA polymerase sigma-70 factor (ECF subfamily)
MNVDTCAEAIRLTRLLTELLPEEPGPQALLALLLFSDSRARARQTGDGRIVLLADQDRTLWDCAAIDEGLALLQHSLRRTAGIADPYQLQASIAAQHAIATSAAQTDWAEILRLYDLLLQVHPNPAAALGRAVAIAEAHGPTAGIAALDALVDRDQRWWAIRAELLARQGRSEAAVEAMRASLHDPLPDAEREHRERRITAWMSAG